MAQFSYNRYPYPDQPQTFFDNFGYSHYEDSRSKSPTSLINHTGLSPAAPLSTPPMSRNPSQLPNQAPDFVMYDQSVNSPSDSSTSVATPDKEFFGEVDMSDDPMHDHHSHRNPDTMMTSHTSQDPVPALLTTFTFSDQVLQQALHATLANEQAQHYQPPLHAQPAQDMFLDQLYNHHYGQNYGNPSYRNDPWSCLRVSSNNAPQPGHVIFDPESDPDLYSYTTGQNVSNWSDNNTDPNYLISPNEPAPRPHDRVFAFPSQDTFQHHQHLLQHPHPHYDDQSPVNSNVTFPLSNPVPQNFVNYDQYSTMFTDDYVAAPQPLVLTTNIPTMAPVSYPSYVEDLSSSNRDQPAPSPYDHAGLSPSASDGMSSFYQTSESGMDIGSSSHEQFEPRPVPPPSLETNSRSPDTSPDIDPEPVPPARKGGAGRPGGRAPGTHLKPTVAKAANDMRKIVACWHCVLQRDRCGPGDICARCSKRASRLNADCGLGCIRLKLGDLIEYFLPTLVTQIHEDAQLTHFVSKHIKQWGNKEITIPMTCGQKSMPRIAVKVYEFLPNGDELLFQIQYTTDPETHKRVAVKKQSPALGMVHINHNEEKRYDRYITEIVDNHIDAFGNLCWMEDDNDFQKKLFRLISRVPMKTSDEAKMQHDVLRLVVCTFIMSHVFAIAEEDKHTVLSKMHSYQGRHSYVENFTSPRMANRQLKYFFCRLHRNIMSDLLNKLQQIFKSSRGCDMWLAAFIMIVGMCMAHEDQQKTIHLVMETKATTEGLDKRDAQGRADIACRDIDDRMSFIINIFRWKYNRKKNPLRDADFTWDAGFGDASTVGFIQEVTQLVKDNTGFLRERQNISISPANQTKYTSRLVSQFLLSFWLPST